MLEGHMLVAREPRRELTAAQSRGRYAQGTRSTTNTAPRAVSAEKEPHKEILVQLQGERVHVLA